MSGRSGIERRTLISNSRTDWASIRVEFITDPTKPQLKQFCGNRNIPYSTASKRAALEKWETDRKAHWKNVEEKATDRVAELQAAVVANDTAQRLVEIRRMQTAALKSAGGHIDNAEPYYEKAGEAVAAYERLVKLERLLIGESTEHIRVDDARQLVRDVLSVIREEVGDDATLQRIVTRLAAVGPVGGSSPRNPLN